MQATFFFSNDDCFIYGLSFSTLPNWISGMDKVSGKQDEKVVL
jgi:hypothetical protein